MDDVEDNEESVADGIPCVTFRPKKDIGDTGGRRTRACKLPKLRFVEERWWDPPNTSKTASQMLPFFRQ